ncbi:MAG: hypothetical protein ABSD76_06390 [Terriglobales bacterium]
MNSSGEIRAAFLDRLRRVFGRRVRATIIDVQATQRKQVDAFLREDFHSGNFNCGGKPDDDSIPSDAFGEW